MVYCGKQDIMLYVLNFKKAVAHSLNYQIICMIHIFLSYLRLTKSIPTLVHARNTKRMNIAFRICQYFTENPVIPKPLDCKFSNDEKQ